MTATQPTTASPHRAEQRCSERGERLDDTACRSFQRTIEQVGSKWTAAVLMAGVQGARRYVEYRSRVFGISNQLLSQRLRELESDGLLERIVVPTTPVQIIYKPTERGASLMRVLDPLVKWSCENGPVRP